MRGVERPTLNKETKIIAKLCAPSGSLKHSTKSIFWHQNSINFKTQQKCLYYSNIFLDDFTTIFLVTKRLASVNWRKRERERKYSLRFVLIIKDLNKHKHNKLYINWFLRFNGGLANSINHIKRYKKFFVVKNIISQIVHACMRATKQGSAISRRKKGKSKDRQKNIRWGH